MLYAFIGHAVVDRSTQAARRTVSLEVRHAVCGAFFYELGVKLLIRSVEAHVHDGTAFGRNACCIEIAGIEIVIEKLCFFEVALFHDLEAADAEQPIHNKLADVDRPAGRRVVHRAVLGRERIVTKRGCERQVVAEQVFADDDDSETGRCDILLSSGIDHAELGYVDRTAHYAGRHVGHERYVACVGDIVPTGTVNRIIEADMYIVGFRIKLKLVLLRYAAEFLVLCRSGDVDFAVLSGLFGSL